MTPRLLKVMACHDHAFWVGGDGRGKVKKIPLNVKNERAESNVELTSSVCSN